MLILKYNQYWNEFLKCHISNEIIKPGDFYYEDTDDGLIVKATIYKKMLAERRKSDPKNYEKINMAENQQAYAEQLKRLEKQYFESTLFDRPVLKNGEVIYNE